MLFDPENRVIKLCAEGMQAEFNSNPQRAHELFSKAWDESADDVEAFTAAHYLARHQSNPTDVLKWNREALSRALTITDDEMKSHYPSLYLNVAKSYEDLGNMAEASSNYKKAAECSADLPAGKYGEMIKSGIRSGIKRTTENPAELNELDELINRWCERKELKALALVLPAYVGHLDTPGDRQKLSVALGYLSATRSLPENEQVQVELYMQKISEEYLYAR